MRGILGFQNRNSLAPVEPGVFTRKKGAEYAQLVPKNGAARQIVSASFLNRIVAPLLGVKSAVADENLRQRVFRLWA